MTFGCMCHIEQLRLKVGHIFRSISLDTCAPDTCPLVRVPAEGHVQIPLMQKQCHACSPITPSPTPSMQTMARSMPCFRRSLQQLPRYHEAEQIFSSSISELALQIWRHIRRVVTSAHTSIPHNSYSKKKQRNNSIVTSNCIHHPCQPSNPPVTSEKKLCPAEVIIAISSPQPFHGRVYQPAIERLASRPRL